VVSVTRVAAGRWPRWSRSRACLARSSWCRRYGSRTRRRGRRAVARMTTAGLGVPHGVVDRTPVRRLDVVPSLVVREGRLVSQVRNGGAGVGWIHLGCRHERPHEGGCRHPGGLLFHFRTHLNRRPSRPMPMRKAHEPRQASRRGLNGSDGSGGTLLAVRDEARRRNVQVRKDGRHAQRFGNRTLPAHHARYGTKRGANVAPV
jgi:hypothetical protein